MLSGSDLDHKEQYRLMLRKARELKTHHVLEREDSIESVRSKLAGIFPAIFSRADKKKGIGRSSGLNLLSLEELEKQIEALRVGEFPNKPESRRAKKYLVEQLIARGFKRAEIAERLAISPKTIYNLLKSSL
jgi:putative transposase